ncbi:hypothetical protein TCAP_05482 [Tolypocladium capitatum]|uniref:Uncharacterized protein n=1 Tax=Tolypocladium capitatum TaxID=45235 RepID=A0A2K3QAL6_9HYPO|nr:hypothetical protein TCAP_05482 [Tolypocladium capitatum]
MNEGRKGSTNLPWANGLNAQRARGSTWGTTYILVRTGDTLRSRASALACRGSGVGDTKIRRWGTAVGSMAGECEEACWCMFVGTRSQVIRRGDPVYECKKPFRSPLTCIPSILVGISVGLAVLPEMVTTVPSSLSNPSVLVLV